MPKFAKLNLSESLMMMDANMNVSVHYYNTFSSSFFLFFIKLIRENSRIERLSKINSIPNIVYI